MRNRVFIFVLAIFIVSLFGCVANQPKVEKTEDVASAIDDNEIAPEADEKNTYNEDGSIKFTQKFKDGNEIEKLSYQYYPTGEVKEILRSVNGLLSGKSVHYNENGSVSKYEFYENDLKNGEFKEFHDNGQVKRVGTYKKDKLNGFVATANEKGNVLSKVLYVDGVEEIASYFEYKEGVLESEKKFKNKVFYLSKKYYANGNLQSKANIHDDVKNGFVEEYYENGSLKKRTNFNNGKESGPEKAYYENGNLKWVATYQQGKLFANKSYTRTGEVSADLTYKFDLKSGVEREFFDSGYLNWEHFYRNGEKTKTKQYYHGGNLAKEIDFKDGKAVKGFIYTYQGNATKMTNAHFSNLGYEY